MILTRIRENLAQVLFPEIVEQRNLLQRLCNVDALTNLANRRAFMHATAIENDSAVIVVFDGDNIGLINKRVGFSVADEQIIRIARTVEAVAHRYGFGERVFRLGGDEFAVICDIKTAILIRDGVEREFGEQIIEGIRVSISGGTGKTLVTADRMMQNRKLQKVQKVYT